MGLRTGFIIWAAVLGGAGVMYGQSLMDPRVVGLGAYVASVKDSRGFTWNPAGLVYMRDWDVSLVTYTGVSPEDGGFVFHGLTLGKRFLDNETVAFEYAPGTRLHLVVPPTLSISGNNEPASNDREIEYAEPGSVGFAHRFSRSFSAAIAGRYCSERITDTKITLFQRDTVAFFPMTSVQQSEARTWLLDFGLLLTPLQKLSIGVTGRNLVHLFETVLPDSLKQYSLDRSIVASLGVAWQFSPSYRLSASLATNGTGAIGHEWTPAWGIAVRNAIYVDKSESRPLAAVSFGVGWLYEFVEVAASYLRYTDRERHSGVVSMEDFDATDIHNLDMNPYVRDRLSLSVKAVFGNVRESLARIENVEMFGAVYPSSFEKFAYRPIGKARLRNTSAKEIQARVGFFVDRFMDAPTESPTVTIEPGGVAEVELTAVFNDHVKELTRMTIREGDVYVAATPAETYDDRAQTRVLFQGKNDWDGSAQSLRYFVTPDDPDILRTSRDILLQSPELFQGGVNGLDGFRKARVLINGFAGKLLYVSDPKLTADYVQYPAETLKIGSGDCDDMTVCFASLLSSIGLSTAFVDVVPPEAPEKSHIYLLFDTGIDPRFGGEVSENPKRYVVRRMKNGGETIWIPIETTVIARGFDEAWTAGAQEYFDDVELGLGLAKGWVRIVDVN